MRQFHSNTQEYSSSHTHTFSHVHPRTQYTCDIRTYVTIDVSCNAYMLPISWSRIFLRIPVISWMVFSSSCTCRPFRSPNHNRLYGCGVILFPFHTHSISIFLNVFLFCSAMVLVAFCVLTFTIVVFYYIVWSMRCCVYDRWLFAFSPLSTM